MSRKNPAAFDIESDGVNPRWNSTDTGWINAPGSADEVGSTPRRATTSTTSA